MSNASDSNPWDRLAPPPREVSPAVQARLRFAEFKRSFNFHSGFLGLWFLLASVILIVGGTAWYHGAKQEGYPFVGALLAAGGIGIVIVMATLIYRRGTRRIRLLRDGIVAQATLTKLWVTNQFCYARYETLLKEWAQFREKLHDRPELLSRVGEQMLDWPCKVRVTDPNGGEHEIATRLNLSGVAIEGSLDPTFPVLCNPPHSSEGIATSEFYSGLTISADGQWTVPDDEGSSVAIASFLRSSVPVVGTYLSAALGLTLFGDESAVKLKASGSPLLLAGIVPLFTITHAVVPVFFFRNLLDRLNEICSTIRTDPTGRLFRAYAAVFRFFVWVFMGIWFALPVIALAYLTGWLSLIWAMVHIVLARRGTRAWTFVEYGSTSMALLLFVVCFSEARLFSLGIVVVVLQALLLTSLDRFARDKWTVEARQ